MCFFLYWLTKKTVLENIGNLRKNHPNVFIVILDS